MSSATAPRGAGSACTVSTSTPEVLAALSASPEEKAVRSWVPAPSEAVTSLAWSLPSRLTVASTVVPSSKVTVPLGSLPLTVANRPSEVPTSTGFAEAVSEVVVAARLGLAWLPPLLLLLLLATTAKLCCTWVAGFQLSSPVWLASTVQVPTASKPRVPPVVTEHTDGVVVEKATERPEEAEAESVGAVPKSAAPGLAKVTVWSALSRVSTARRRGSAPLDEPPRTSPSR